MQCKDKGVFPEEGMAVPVWQHKECDNKGKVCIDQGK
jgi:hypothetical protein